MMKKASGSIMVFLTCSLLLSLCACNSGQSKEGGETEETSTTESADEQISEESPELEAIDRPELDIPVTSKAMSTEELVACTKFLDEYEAWSDDFIAAATKMMEDPSNEANKQEYKEVASKMAEWTSKWTQIQGCPDHPDFKEKFEEIAKKITEELEKLEIK